jgi:hypothetical protein
LRVNPVSGGVIRGPLEERGFDLDNLLAQPEFHPLQLGQAERVGAGALHFPLYPRFQYAVPGSEGVETSVHLCPPVCTEKHLVMDT